MGFPETRREEQMRRGSSQKDDPFSCLTAIKDSDSALPLFSDLCEHLVPIGSAGNRS